MCGLTGFLARGGLQDGAAESLAAMSASLHHRGPDDHGAWLDAQAGIALGSTRLAIIDLSPLGRMPMQSPGGRYVAAYNGEIYNFAELRSELQAAGVAFRGRSDTEVLLGAIEQWGLEAALRRAAGMFALALWDRESRTLSLCRDRMGEKPLYWAQCGTQGGEVLLFGSELKALRRHPAWRGGIDANALALYLRLGYVPAPYTIHPGVRKVVPGGIVAFRAGQAPAETRYWSVRPFAEEAARAPRAGTLEDWSERMDAALRRTVREEMVADVPVGAFLSGGIDSSLITALMQQESGRPARTFTIGFTDPAYDEATYARAVAKHLRTEHTEVVLTPAEALAIVPTLHQTYDEPFGDSSQIPTVLVSRLARRHVTVCLSGDGGDELFGGYQRYHWGFPEMESVMRLPGPLRRLAGAGVAAMPGGFWNAAARVAAPLLPERLQAPQFEPKLRAVGTMLGAESPQAFYLAQMSQWHAPERAVRGAREPLTAYSDPACWLEAAHPVARLMYMDQLTYLPDDILVKVDRASMAASLELRAPFLDHRVVELAWQVPPSMNVRGGAGKHLLKGLLARHVPPALTERPKQGFGVPVGAWLRSELREWAEALLAPQALEADGLLRAGPVRDLWRQHLAGPQDHGAALWHVLMYQDWRRHV